MILSFSASLSLIMMVLKCIFTSIITSIIINGRVVDHGIMSMQYRLEAIMLQILPVILFSNSQAIAYYSQ